MLGVCVLHCKKEALNLALKYNFVTDLTSLVIEENVDYIKSGQIDVNSNPTYKPPSRPSRPSSSSRPSIQSSFSNYGPGILARPPSTAHGAGGRAPLHSTSSGVSKYFTEEPRLLHT